jgi:hypothetical protein
MATILRIVRNLTSMGSFVGIARQLQVFVDGSLVGTVSWNSSADFAVHPGNRIIYVKMDWCSSREMSVNFDKDETVVLECHAPSLSISVTGILGRIFGYPNDFFSLHRKH